MTLSTWNMALKEWTTNNPGKQLGKKDSDQYKKHYPEVKKIQERLDKELKKRTDPILAKQKNAEVKIMETKEKFSKGSPVIEIKETKEEKETKPKPKSEPKSEPKQEIVDHKTGEQLLVGREVNVAHVIPLYRISGSSTASMKPDIVSRLKEVEKAPESKMTEAIKKLRVEEEKAKTRNLMRAAKPMIKETKMIEEEEPTKSSSDMKPIVGKLKEETPYYEKFTKAQLADHIKKYKEKNNISLRSPPIHDKGDKDFLKFQIQRYNIPK